LVTGNPIALDPCSNPDSLVKATTEYRLPERNGLHESWGFPTIYVNPPFGRCFIHKTAKFALSQKEFKTLVEADPAKADEFHSSNIVTWIEHCEAAAKNGSHVIILCPAAVDTAGWQEHILKTAEQVCLLRGRVKFVGAPNVAPQAIAMAYWGTPDGGQCFKRAFADMGMVFPARVLSDEMAHIRATNALSDYWKV
jgi:hypothetical protein